MPDRPPNLGWAPRAALSAALLPLLADCGPPRNQFAPPCPGQAILGDVADYDMYRGSAIAGRERPDRPGAARPDRRHPGQLPEGDRKNQLAVTASVGSS